MTQEGSSYAEDGAIFHLQQLDHVAIIVKDLERSVAWHQQMLGMEERQRYRDTTGNGSPVVTCSGDGCVALFPPAAQQTIAVPEGRIAFSRDRRNVAQARNHLRRQEVDIKCVAYETMHSVYLPIRTATRSR